MSSSSSTITAELMVQLLAGLRFHFNDEQMLNLLKEKMEGKLDSQASHIMPESGYQTWEPGNQSISRYLLFLTEMMQGKLIPLIDVLKSEPWDLPGLMFADSRSQPWEWFAFSLPDHINIHSPRCNRATEKGFWKITGKHREIKSQEHSFTCIKRTLTFHIGRVGNSEKTDWVMHEYLPTETKLGSSSFVLIRVKKKSANHKSDIKKLKTIASNSRNQPTADAINQPAAHGEPKDVQFGSGDHDVGEPGGFVSSACGVDDMILEYQLHDLDYSPFPTPEPPQQPELVNVPDVSNYESSNRQSPIGDNGKEPVSTIANEAPDEKISEEENLESRFHPSHLQDCAWQSPFNYWEELGDFLHTNNYIGCNGSEFLHMEIPAFFPQSS